MILSPSLNQLLQEKNSVLLAEKVNSLNAFELVDILRSKKEEDYIFIFNLLNPKLAARIYGYLPLKMQKEIVDHTPASQLVNMLKGMQSDECIAFLEDFPREVVDEYVKSLPSYQQIMLLELLGYPEGSVGRLITTYYIAIKEDWTVAEVIEHIQSMGSDQPRVSDVYVIDNEDQVLRGIGLKNFFLYSLETQVFEIPGKKTITLNVLDKEEKAIQAFKQCGYYSLPVVDGNGQMIGVITMDDILRVASKLTTEKIQKIGGMEALDESYMDTPFLQLIKKRVRWLVILFFGELMTATALGFFEEQISKAVVLALFLPLIISSGGNAGSQSSTLIIRAMALGEVKMTQWRSVFKWEIFAGILLGIILGIIGFARVSLWSTFSNIYGSHWVLIAFTIFFSLIGVVLWGSLIGAMLPFILKKIGADPATSSAPLVATLVDVTGIIIYFYIAMWILKGVML